MFNMDNLMKWLTGNFSLEVNWEVCLKPKLKGMAKMIAGIRGTAHIAREVQHKGIPSSKADQKTTENKSEVDKEQVWQNNQCRKAVFKKLKLYF